MKILKSVMLINAVSSAATGLLLAIFPSPAARLFGYPQTLPFSAVGIFLVVFAILVFLQGKKAEVNKGWLKLIIALDILWVAKSILIVSFQSFALTPVGYLLIGAVAAWVGAMAFFQIRGLKAISIIPA